MPSKISRNSIPRIYIQEVSMRDGFQIEPVFIPTDKKIDLANSLSRTGLVKIEVTSFASPKTIPALADAEQVMKGIDRIDGVEYAALVPNLRGAERAIACDVDELNIVVSVSETHNRANLRLSRAHSLQQIGEIVRFVNDQAQINVSLSTAFGCPFEGEMADSNLLDFVAQTIDLGIMRLTLCDTTGMANPAQVRRLCLAVFDRWPQLSLTAHFHDTRAMGLANALAALESGVVRFDASLGGLGGCPFAPGASGNICTEDLVHMFEEMGGCTGVNLEKLLLLARQLPQLVGHNVPGKIINAGPSSRRYPQPELCNVGASQPRLAGTDTSAIDPR